MTALGLFPDVSYGPQAGEGAQRKFTRFRNRERAAMHWLGRVARREPYLFAHWQLGMRPAAGV